MAQEKGKALAVLQDCLSDVAIISLDQITPGRAEDEQPDFTIKIRTPEGELVLLGEFRTSGQPRLAREVSGHLRRYRDMHPGAYGIFMAPYISERAAEICRQEGIGYIDLAGNCRLALDRVYIRIEGKPNPFARKRDLRSLYSPKAERVLRVLLENPGVKWKTEPLAGEAKVSMGQVHNVKELLSDREWVTTSKEGFSLVEPVKLLEEWAENHSFRRNQVNEFFTLKPLNEIESDIAETCGRIGSAYALTAFSGAVRMAPFVRYQRAFAYVTGDIEDLASRLQLRQVSSGANVTLLTPYDEGVFYGSKEMNGIRVACSVQVFLDLWSFRGRGREAANHLLKEVIRPRW